MIYRPEFLVGHKITYALENGHLVCTCKTLSYVSKIEASIKFIHDTGAFISTLSRNLYEQLDFDKIDVDKHDVELGSYNSVTKGLVFTLPFIFITSFTVKNVQIFVPNSYKYNQNLLAMNVLGLFNQCIETSTSSIYLNPHNKKLNFKLIAESVFAQNKQ